VRNTEEYYGRATGLITIFLFVLSFVCVCACVCVSDGELLVSLA
jgi:hypothetical protein